jgi:hypothetical protein
MKPKTVSTPKISFKKPIKLGGGTVVGSQTNNSKPPSPNKPVSKKTNP